MRVLVVGDVIEDILVTPKTQIRFDTDTQSEIHISPGGSGANFACWLSAAKVPVDFVGRIGAADLHKHSADLASHGITPHLQTDEKLPTGKIVVLVEGNQRSFLTDRGANQNLDFESIPDSLFGSALYISGYSLLNANPGQIQRLIARAKSANSLVVCDPGSAGFIKDFGALAFLEAFAGVDVFLPSWEEGRVLTGEEKPEDIAGILNQRFKVVALTLGEHGAQIAADELNIRVDAPLADSIDPTGAGDAFAASFLKELLLGKSLEDCAKSAVKQGAIAVTLPGGRPRI